MDMFDEEMNEALEGLEITTLTEEEVRKKYSNVLDKLEWLEKQPMQVAAKGMDQLWDVRILKHAGGKITGLKKKLVQASNVLFGKREEVELFHGSLAFQSAGTRGAAIADSRSPEKFFFPIVGGTLEIVLEARDGSSGELKIKIALLDQDQTRVDRFLLTIEDLETNEAFFIDKQIDQVYMNDRIGDGLYKITARNDVIGGSAVIEISSKNGDR